MATPTRRGARRGPAAGRGAQTKNGWESNGWHAERPARASEGALEISELRDYLGMLRRRAGTIILAALVGLVAAAGFAYLQPKTYTSNATVLATNPLSQFVSANTLANPNMVDEQARASSIDVAVCAERIMAQPAADPRTICTATAPAGSALPTTLLHKLTVTVGPTTDVLKISYSAGRPADAQRTAEAFAQAYVTVTTLGAQAYVKSNQDALQARTDALNTQIRGLDAQIAKLEAKGANGNSPQVQALQTQADQLSEQMRLVESKLLDLDPAKITPPKIQRPANLPGGPSSPHTNLMAAIGLLIGLFGGTAFALVRESMNDSIRDRDDLEEHGRAPVLAEIPKVRGWRRDQKESLVSLTQAGTAFAEAYRALATRVQILAAQRGMDVLMVTSADRGEGKSSVTANLAAIMAEAGRRMILISADLRRPRLARLFKLNEAAGLSNVLAGECSFAEALQLAPEWNLRVLASGPPVASRPATLLQSRAMADVIEEARQAGDFVLIDTPPILLVADAVALMPLVDGVLFVATERGTTREQVSRARSELDEIHATLVGSVLNKTERQPSSGYWAYGFPDRPV